MIHTTTLQYLVPSAFMLPLELLGHPIVEHVIEPSGYYTVASVAAHFCIVHVVAPATIVDVYPAGHTHLIVLVPGSFTGTRPPGHCVYPQT